MSNENTSPQPYKLVYGVPKVTCLCATKGRYQLLRSAVSYFMLQDYPNKELIIFNNHEVDIELSDFVKNQGNIHLVNAGEFSSISDVYNTAYTYVDSFGGQSSEFIAIWDDDDIYFPWHLSIAVRHLSKSTTHTHCGPQEQLQINHGEDCFPKLGAIRSSCEGRLLVRKCHLDTYGFGPDTEDPAAQQHPHPAWLWKGSILEYPWQENSFVYFWGDENRVKPYPHLQCGDGKACTDTGGGKPLYPGPTYYKFIQDNLYLKKHDEEYTEQEKKEVVDRLNSYDWQFFEERKLFTFWEGEKPYFIEKCLESMKKNSNCVFEIWDSDKLKKAFDIPAEYDSLTVESKSDYVRQRVLAEQGGLWLDADTIVISDMYEPILKYTWEYDQVTPCESNHHRGVICGAMACRPKSQVFQRVMKSVNAVMPLNLGWADLINTPVKNTIREYTSRNMVKYVDESVMSLKLVQNPKGGFGELYCSPTMSISDIVMDNTAGIVLYGSNIRGKEKHRMPDDYLLQRLIDKYLDSPDVQQVTDKMNELNTISEGALVDIVKESISDSMRHMSKLSPDGMLPNGCPQGMTSPKIRHLVNSLLSRMPNNTNYLEIGTWQGGVLIPGLYGNDHINVSVIDIFTDPNARNYGSAGLDGWEHHTSTKEAFFRNLDVYLPGRESLEVYVNDCFEDNILPNNRTYKVYFFDGPHDKESQKKALVQYAEYMDDVFVYLVDDFLEASVQEGTEEGIAACNLEVLYKQELFSRWNGDTENYWNGFGVFVLKRL